MGVKPARPCVKASTVSTRPGAPLTEIMTQGAALIKTTNQSTIRLCENTNNMELR